MRTRSFGHAALFARGFGFAGRGHLTVVLKVSGSFDPATGEVAWSQSASIVSGERSVRDRPGASLEHASDVALFVPRAEVMVMGHAHAQGGPAEEVIVGLDLIRAGTPVFSKSLRVMGDRKAEPGKPMPRPAPFEVMPLSYERSFGGRSNPVNPVGVGEELGPDGLLVVPNLLPLEGHAQVAPIGFGPISSAWPFRASRRGSVSQEDLANQSWVDLPPGFDQGFFQAAPPDQATADLWGGDLIVLRGMHPTLPVMRLVVPPVAATGLLAMPRGERRLLSLRLDTIFISAASCSCEFLFRTNTPFNRADLETAFVAGALHPVGVPFAFPHSFEEEAPVGRPRAFFGTDVIELPVGGLGLPDLALRGMPAPQEHDPDAGPKTMVFADAHDATDDAGPRTVLFEDVRAGAFVDEPSPKTMIFDEETTQGLPVEGSKFSSTLVVELEAAPASLPFANRSKPATRGASVEAPPGSPWALTSAPAPKPVAAPSERTLLDLEAKNLLAAAAPEEAPAPPDPAPPSMPTSSKRRATESKRKKVSSVWREDPPEAKVPVSAPKAPAPPPKADLSRHLYRKAKRP